MRSGGKKSDRETVTRWLRQAERQGWRMDETKGRTRLFPPDRDIPPIIIHNTLGEYRSAMNYRSQLRRAGLDI